MKNDHPIVIAAGDANNIGASMIIYFLVTS
jgi:hypothetical protein